MNGFKRLVAIKIPPNWISAIPAVYALLNKLFPNRWTFKVSWQVKANGQIALIAELRLGKPKR